MANKSKDRERSLAEFLYIEQGLSLSDISAKIDIPLKTLSLWKRGRKGEKDWDYRKGIIISAPHSIKETILVEMQKILAGEKSNIDADAIVKLANSIDKIDKKLSIQTITSVIMMLDTFLAKEEPAEATRCLPYHKRFILNLIASDGEV